MRIGLLGPLSLTAADGRPVDLPGARVRRLLAVLALTPGEPVSTDRLIEAIWPADPVRDAPHALQMLVSRLRRTVPVTQAAGGYLLALRPDAVDAVRFTALVAAARDTEPVEARKLLREALALWRGDLPAELTDVELARPLTAAWESLRVDALAARFEADLALGDAGSCIPEAFSVVLLRPLDERLRALLMRLLAAVGRTADALAVFEEGRRAVADELGVAPSPELRNLHLRLLRGPVEEPALPPALTSFVGRDADLAAVADLLSGHRLVTLLGPGGVGKTRLALETGRREGSGTVRLAELADATDALQAVAKVLIGGAGSKGLFTGPPAPGSELDRVAEVLGDRRTLLLLDNCEHLVAAAADLVGALLTRCPGLRVLATSREPLGVAGEALWTVDPLDVDGTAERLFVDRARAARPRSEPEPAVVARICRTLDGLPLAIELAAARLRVLSAEEVADRLADRFALLTNGGRSAPARHQTLRAAVGWSFDLLSPAERRLARHLAVHAGIALAAAVLLAGAGGLDLVTGLADKSIVVAEAGPDGTRLRMLATIRAYALDGAPDEDAAREWHARYYADLGERAQPYLWTRDQLGWLRRLVTEQDNLDAALRWAVEQGRGDLAMRLIAVAAAGPELGGAHLGAFPVAARAFDLPGARDVPRGTRAQALMIAALVGLGAGAGFPTVAAWFTEALELVREAEADGETLSPTIAGIEALSMLMLGGDPADLLAHLEGLEAHPVPWVRACGHLMRGHFLASQGGAEAAHGQLTVAVAQLRPLGERWALSLALQGLAGIASARGDTATAIAHLEEQLALVRELNDQPRQAATLVALGEERLRAGQPDDAEADLAAGETLARGIGARETLARRYTVKGEIDSALAELDGLPRAAALTGWVLCERGRGRLRAGDVAGARRDRDEAYALVVEPADGRALAWVAVFAAEVALATGDPAGAALLLGAGDTLRGGGDVREPLATAPRTPVPTRDQALAVLRSGVGTPAVPAVPAPG